MDSNDPDLDEETRSFQYPTNSMHPVPSAVLKVQIKRLVQQHCDWTHQCQEPQVIATKDLLAAIDTYEHENNVILLTLNQKTAIQPYTLLDPELEMTCDDILNLIKLTVATCPPSAASLSVPILRLPVLPQTPATFKSANRSKHLGTTNIHTVNSLGHVSTSYIDHDHGPGPIPSSELTHSGDSNQQPTTKQMMNEVSDDENGDEFVHYYRRSLALTQQLMLSEKNLASMTRDNEDQIATLQNRVDEMTNQVSKQKRELLEYKTKETKSLEQIGMLEAHIDTIQKSETDQKQVYLSIKTLYDEKCGETQKLQELLRQKEADLQQTEAFLSNFHHEFMLLTEERNQLALLQQDLEKELIASHATHTQLAEQRSENERLKQVIDTLKFDLDLARYEQMSSGLPNTTSLIKTLEAELEGQLQLKEDEDAKTLERVHEIQRTDERLISTENEKDYYKSRATEAIKDLGRVKAELSLLRKAMYSENWCLMNEMDDLQTKKNGKSSSTARRSLSAINDEPHRRANNVSSTSTMAYNSNTSIPSSSISTSSSTSTINSISSANINECLIHFLQPSIDVWSQSRSRAKKLGARKKREVIDLHNISSTIVDTSSCKNGSSADHHTTVLANRQKNDKLITGTTTFAIYTLLVYVFGIVTSTFLIESGSQASWEQALMVTAGQSANGNYKLLDILLYWIEKLLFESDGVALS